MVVEPDNPHFDAICEVDFSMFDSMTADACKKKVNLLMKVRAKIQKNMTVSGEHDSDPFNFMEVARKSVKGGALTNIGCYYFFIRCNEYPEVDIRFNLQLDENVAGNTDENHGMVPTVAANSGKKIAMKTMAEIATSSQEIAVEMKETNRLGREANDTAKLAVETAKRTAQTQQLIQMAPLLGRTEALEQLFANSAAALGYDLP